jgi:hypothetical protein
MAKKRKGKHADKRGSKDKPASRAVEDKPVSRTAEDKPATHSAEDKPVSRGAQRRQAARAERAADPIATLGPAEEPAFWFGFDVTWAKLVLLRFVVFALLAIDALMQIEHAPRYGAGDFNVAQLPLLAPLAPGRAAYAIGELVLAYLLAFAACGVLVRYVLPIATALYGWLYFSSHLDSYQHHYLVWLILLLACFVPWQRPAGSGPNTRVRSWALRLICIQLAILYFWAAVSKMSDAWIDGRTLAGQMQGSVRSLIDATVGMKGAAWLVLVTELVLAATVWSKRTWPIAAPLGIALHVGILATNLDIGLFAYLMLGLYILIVPDRVWTYLAGLRPLATARELAAAIREWFGGTAGQWLVWILAVATGLVLAAVSCFDHGLQIGLVGAGALVILTVASAMRRLPVSIAALASAHLLALVIWTAVDRTTKTASDYFRLWGGSAKRLGDPKAAEYAYRRMTEVAPDEGGGHYQLGKLLLDRKADDEGIAELHKAQDLEPLRARAYVAEARWLAAKGRIAEAIAKAREATIVEPNDSEANSLLNSLLSR